MQQVKVSNTAGAPIVWPDSLAKMGWTPIDENARPEKSLCHRITNKALSDRGTFPPTSDANLAVMRHALKCGFFTTVCAYSKGGKFLELVGSNHKAGSFGFTL